MSLLESMLETAVATSEMSKDDLHFIFSQGERKVYAPGDYLFHESTPRLWAGIIEDGLVEVIRERNGATTFLSILAKGAMIAETAILGDSSHDASAFTRSGATVWQVPSNIWQTIRQSYPDVFYRNVGRIATKQRYAAEQLAVARELLAANQEQIRQEGWLSKEDLDYILKP